MLVAKWKSILRGSAGRAGEGTRVLSAFGEPRSGKARQREKRRDPDELASYTLPSPSGFFAALRMTQVVFQTSGFFGRRRDLQDEHTSIPVLKGETWGTRVLSVSGQPRSGKARQREKRRDPDELASYTLPSPSGFFAALRMTHLKFGQACGLRCAWPHDIFGLARYGRENARFRFGNWFSGLA